MSAGDVVDIGTVPLEMRRRRMWLRIGVPIGGVALVIMAILAITLYSDRVNRAGVLSLSDNLLAELQARIAQQVAGYLDPATRSALLARDMTARNAVQDRRDALRAYAASTLRQTPQIAAFYVGDAQGDFMMVRRGANGGTDIKLISNAPDARRVEWIHRDPDGHVTGREQDPSDDYDPRTRDWYKGALKTDDVFWTGVYVFFTDRAPGVTASIRYRGPDNAGQVFGVDITLDALSRFLASLKIGHSGRAVIFDGAGNLIAAANGADVLREQNGQLTARSLDQLGDPAITGAYDRFRVEGYGRRLIQLGSQRIVSIVSRLPAANDWSLLIVVPETDFTGFVSANSRWTLALSLVVIALTALLAALLVRQGLRADRTARQLLDRGAAIERQGAAFADLARQQGLFDPAQEAPLQGLTEMLASIGGARRASIWRLSGEGRLLRCEDSFDSDSGGHVAGLELSREELPQFFAALMEAAEIRVPDAANDRRTAELHRILMHPSGRTGLHVVPVPGESGVTGAILLEDASRLDEAQDFLRAAAGMLGVRMRGAAGEAHAVPAAPVAASPAMAAAERSFTAELALHGLDTAAIGAEVFPSVAVMVMKFSDPAAMATRKAPDPSVLADRIAVALQEIAAAHDIPYVKMVGQDVVAAAGWTPGDADAVLRIADAALAARDGCMALFEAADHPPSFRIGIDHGIAIGSQIGQQPRLFNLWGEAVRTAEAMAASAIASGAIQVSEAAYRRLRHQFLFRPRGSFYLPRVGAAQTFVLGSRL